MTERSHGWMPREAWDALVRGEGCPLCAKLTSNEGADEHGIFIAKLRVSRLQLAANQYVLGYCILIFHRHVREPYDLSDQERSLFFEDMSRAGQALDRAFNPIKMNFQFLG